MKLSDQVITLEQAKRLKELGVDGPALFWHTQERTPLNPNMHYFGWKQESMPWEIFYGKRSPQSTTNVFEDYPAFTASEVGKLLPDGIIKDQYCYYLSVEKASYVWIIGYMAESETQSWFLGDEKSESKNESEARTAMLIYLLENNLTTPEECNKRLTE